MLIRNFSSLPIQYFIIDLLQQKNKKIKSFSAVNIWLGSILAKYPCKRFNILDKMLYKVKMSDKICELKAFYLRGKKFSLNCLMKFKQFLYFEDI